MAHKYKIKPVPHKNKDGSISANKKDYEVYDRTRGKKRRVGIRNSRKAAVELIEQTRAEEHMRHLEQHPNDQAFRQKHRIGESA